MNTPNLHITTRAGKLRGTLASDTVRVFRGIPYGQAPVGELRWRPPVAAAAWSGTRDALEFGPDCPQTIEVGSRAPGQSEDCLSLNIWTPADTGSQPLPVLVWVHGGSYVSGSGSESRLDGARLAGLGMVVVTINYRVGVFGFLAHPGLTGESPHQTSSNYGLMDQMLALQWVQDNIAEFGGDPERVTAFGVSAGSASVALLLVSEQARGLFQQAILQSPGTARRLASLEQAEQAGLALGEDIAALRRLSGEEVLARTPLLAPKVRGLTTPRVLRPIRDGWLLREDEALAYAHGRIQTMPLLLGTNLDEGSEATANWPIRTPQQYLDLLADSFGDQAGRALELYPAADEAEVRLRVAELFADTQFNYGTRLLTRTMAQREPRTWRYVYTHRRAHRSDGPHHGQEVHFVFGNLLAPYPGEQPLCDARDEALSAAMMQAWTNFARSGDPNGAQAPAWSAYRPDQDNHLELGSTIAAGQGWRRDQLDFLEAYFRP